MSSWLVQGAWFLLLSFFSVFFFMQIKVLNKSKVLGKEGMGPHRRVRRAEFFQQRAWKGEKR